MLDELIPKRKGKLSIPHKIAVKAVGTFMVWLGNAFLKLETYEELEILEGEANEYIEKLEKTHPELNDIS